jgi:SAM-dependent methyltransferase
MNTPEPRQPLAAGTTARRAVTNPFDSDAIARRYARARPYYHCVALGLAARQLGISRARIAVDVGCGTGLSTRAVLELAERVIAIDASAAMLRASEPHLRACYLVASAEQLPVRDTVADLATVGAALHWFDQPRAFAELARVLRTGAGLAVYSDFFLGQLNGQPAFTTWLEDAYLPRYPAPPRHAHFDSAAAMHAGFSDVSYAEDTIRVPLTHNELANYLLTQSNAATAVESGAVSAETLRNKIMTETAPFFPGQRLADAAFAIRVWTTIRSG